MGFEPFEIAEGNARACHHGAMVVGTSSSVTIAPNAFVINLSVTNNRPNAGIRSSSPYKALEVGNRGNVTTRFLPYPSAVERSMIAQWSVLACSGRSQSKVYYYSTSGTDVVRIFYSDLRASGPMNPSITFPMISTRKYASLSIPPCQREHQTAARTPYLHICRH